mgnify:CR=1 FL=1
MAAALEAICFPPEQAASPTTIAERMATYADHFWLIEDEGGMLLALVNGLCTHERDLSDEMYEAPTMHDPDGAWQMILGVATAPAAQGQGLATRLLRTVIETTRVHGRQGLVLTCLDDLVGFYARLGFVDEGLSASHHGGRALAPDAAHPGLSIPKRPPTGTFHAAGCVSLRPGAFDAVGDSNPVPQRAGRPQPEENVPARARRPRS